MKHISAAQHMNLTALEVIVDLCLDRAELSNISVIKQELSFYDRQDVRRPPS